MKFKNDFDHMPGLLFCKDLEGRYLWANQGLLDLLKDEVIGKDDWALISNTDEVEGILAMDRAVVDREETMTCVEKLHVGDEEQRFVTYKSPLRDEFGEIIGIQGCSLPLGSDHLTDLERTQ